MSRIDTWMPLYIGDYLADTRRLTTTEHGAYLLLLMEQWRRGWLPDDDVQLARITGLRIEQWRRCAGTLRCFFDAGDLPGTIRQKRLHAEREKAIALSAKRAEVAGSRWSNSGARGGTGSEPKPLKTKEASDANAEQKEPFCITQSQSPLPRKEEIEPSGSISRAMRVRASDAFDAWWDFYPRKAGKDAARKAYAMALKRGATDADLALGLQRQRWPDEVRFIPHPATWLNQGRWQDDPDASAPSRSKDDWIYDDANFTREPRH
jgi:uncharacterized protein YdaU (DUF1376 family)